MQSQPCLLSFSKPALGRKAPYQDKSPPRPPRCLPPSPLPSQPESWVAVGGAGFADGCIYHAGGLAKWLNPLRPAGVAGSRLGGLPCWQLPSPVGCLTGSSSPGSTRRQGLPPSSSTSKPQPFLGLPIARGCSGQQRCTETRDSKANVSLGPRAKSSPNRARARSRGRPRPGCWSRS